MMAFLRDMLETLENGTQVYTMLQCCIGTGHFHASPCFCLGTKRFSQNVQYHHGISDSAKSSKRFIAKDQPYGMDKHGKKTDQTQNHLFIQHTKALLSLVTNLSKVPSTVAKIDSIFQEDDNKSSFVKTLWWRRILEQVDTTIECGKALQNAIQDILDSKPHANKGPKTNRP